MILSTNNNHRYTKYTVETSPRSCRRTQTPLQMVLLHEQKRPRTLEMLRSRRRLRRSHRSRKRYRSTHPKAFAHLGKTSALQWSLWESTGSSCYQTYIDERTLWVDSMLQSLLWEVEDVAQVDGWAECIGFLYKSRVLLCDEYLGWEGGELWCCAGEFASVWLSSLGYDGWGLDMCLPFIVTVDWSRNHFSHYDSWNQIRSAVSND